MKVLQAIRRQPIAYLVTGFMLGAWVWWIWPKTNDGADLAAATADQVIRKICIPNPQHADYCAIHSDFDPAAVMHGMGRRGYNVRPTDLSDGDLSVLVFVENGLYSRQPEPIHVGPMIIVGGYATVEFHMGRGGWGGVAPTTTGKTKLIRVPLAGWVVVGTTWESHTY